MMNNIGKDNAEADDLVAMTRALIERSSLGEARPRRLRAEADGDQVDKIRRMLDQRSQRGGESREFARREVVEPIRLPEAAPRIFRRCGKPDVLYSESENLHTRRRKRVVDLIIQSESIAFDSHMPALDEDFTTYIVMVYSRIGTCVMIATPSWYPERRQRISTIFAAAHRKGSPRCKEPDLFQSVARSIVSDYANRQPSLDDALNDLAVSFRPDSSDSRTSPRSPHGGLNGSLLPYFRSVVRRKLGIEIGDQDWKVPGEDLDRPERVGLSAASGIVENAEMLVIAANEHGVGVSVELGNAPSDSLRHVVQSTMPKAMSATYTTPEVREKLIRVAGLLKSGGRFARSWDGDLNRNTVHDIVRVFSSVVKNIPWMPVDAESEIECVIGEHLKGLGSQSGAGSNVATQSRSKSSNSVKGVGNGYRADGHATYCPN